MRILLSEGNCNGRRHDYLLLSQSWLLVVYCVETHRYCGVELVLLLDVHRKLPVLGKFLFRLIGLGHRV